MATEELIPGFRFSTCAYALHLLHERVATELELDLDLLPPVEATVVLPDGRVARPDESGARELGVVDAWRAWEREWDEAAHLVDETLLGPPPAWDELERQTRFARVSMNELLRERFESVDARVVFARPYFEGDPDEPGGPLAYAWVETSRCRDARWQGVPRGGMGAVAAAFVRAAERAGVRVEIGADVVQVEPERVALADGRAIGARAVLVNAPPRARVPGPRAAKTHCALRGEPDLGLLEREPDELGVVHVYAEGGGLVELQLPSLRDRSLAPDGGHTLSIFAPGARDDALELAERAIPNLREVLAGVVHHGPAELPLAQIHHVPHVPAAMYDRRGGARAERVYRCGASAHPGGEVSGVPGWNAAHAVLEDFV